MQDCEKNELMKSNFVENTFNHHQNNSRHHQNAILIKRKQEFLTKALPAEKQIQQKAGLPGNLHSNYYWQPMPFYFSDRVCHDLICAGSLLQAINFHMLNLCTLMQTFPVEVYSLTEKQLVAQTLAIYNCIFTY